MKLRRAFDIVDRVTTVTPIKRGLKVRAIEPIDTSDDKVTTVTPIKRGLKVADILSGVTSSAVLQPLPRLKGD